MPSQVRPLRVRNGLSQVELARLLEVDVATVRRWEAGTTMPRMWAQHHLAGVFRCSVDELGLRREG